MRIAELLPDEHWKSCHPDDRRQRVVVAESGVPCASQPWMGGTLEELRLEDVSCESQVSNEASSHNG